jgi:hypothetical protein
VVVERVVLLRTVAVAVVWVWNFVTAGFDN